MHELTSYAIFYTTKELTMAAYIEQILEKADCNARNEECIICECIALENIEYGMRNLFENINGTSLLASPFSEFL
jgi:hypothetical protein